MADLLTPSQVAEEFGVRPETVTQWADEGRIPSIRTLGGHRRFHREDVERLVRESAGGGGPAEASAS